MSTTSRDSKRPIFLHLWDALAWLTLGVPLLTGGIFLAKPGLKVEISEVSIPALLLLILAWVLKRSKRISVRDATFLRAARSLWRSWSHLIQTRPALALGGGAACASLILAATSLRRHASFNSSSYDLGLFINGFWNLLNSGRYTSAPRGGIELLTDHQMYIAWPLAWIFGLAPGAEILLTLQAAALALGGVPLYFIARQTLSKHHWGIAGLPLLYWAYVPVRNSNAFDFHPEVFALPIFLTAIACIQSMRNSTRAIGLVLFALGLACKETSAAVGCGIGLAWALGAGPEISRAWTRKLGVGLACAGAGVFGFDLWVMPKLLASEHFHLNAHSAVDWSLAHLVDGARRKYLLWTLGGLAFLPLFSWKELLAAAPMYALLFLTGGDIKISLEYHYAPELAVGLFWAATRALAGPRPSTSKRYARVWRAWTRPQVVAIIALIFLGRPEFARVRMFAPTEHHAWLRSEFLPSIHPNASLGASTALVPHLATRPWIHSLGRITDGQGAPVACIVSDRAVNNWGFEPLDEGTRAQWLSRGYGRIYQCGSVEVFQHASFSSGNCFTRTPNCPEPAAP